MIHPADKKLAETAGKIPVWAIILVVVVAGAAWRISIFVWAIILVVVVAGAFYSYRESKARKDYK